MEFALWNRAAVMQLMSMNAESDCRCGMMATTSNVGGFAPQKPIKKAYEQRPDAVKNWLDNEYPAIEHRVKAEGAEIHWGDETAVVNTDVRGRSYHRLAKHW